MSTTIIIIVAIVVIYFAISTTITEKRQIAFNNINVLYDEMEMYIIKNKITLTGEVLTFLRNHKQYKVNNELADIQILFLSNQSKFQLEQLAQSREKITQKLPKEFVEIGNRLYAQVNHAIFLSIFRKDFLFMIVYMIVKGLV